MGTQEPRPVIWRRFYRHGMPLYRATLRGIDYAITKDGADGLPWRVYTPEGGNGWPFDATFRTLTEAKAAAEQNAMG